MVSKSPIDAKVVRPEVTRLDASSKGGRKRKHKKASKIHASGMGDREKMTIPTGDQKDETAVPTKSAETQGAFVNASSIGDDTAKTGYLASQETSFEQATTSESKKTNLEPSPSTAKPVSRLSSSCKALLTSPPSHSRATISKGEGTARADVSPTLASKVLGTKVANVDVSSITVLRSKRCVPKMPPPLSRSVKTWTVAQVAQLLRDTPNCAPYAAAFEANEIDGEALILLKFSHFVEPPLCMKVGHAAKFAIRVLKLADNPSTTFPPSSFIASFLGSMI
ncbi:unnamed protein product [Hydatigera taeniaeformis]|uniref:SAM domain-containing protein n=1 Tax=Hydatigena taeniaeformis TaxID=6205 RepID=A0A0R3WKH4_HYDTA|nr:unnamed protein product [Hydatigera taeniaeformis]